MAGVFLRSGSLYAGAPLLGKSAERLTGAVILIYLWWGYYRLLLSWRTWKKYYEGWKGDTGSVQHDDASRGMQEIQVTLKRLAPDIPGPGVHVALISFYRTQRQVFLPALAPPLLRYAPIRWGLLALAVWLIVR